MTLDFSNAEIVVQNDQGSAIPAIAYDSDGNILERSTVRIDFNDREGFLLSRQTVSQITLDFDLDSSNDIEIDGDSASVTVSTSIVADTILEQPKPFRLRGVLSDVDLEEQVFTLAIRPFRIRSGDFGQVDLKVDSETAYEVWSATEGV